MYSLNDQNTQSEFAVLKLGFQHIQRLYQYPAKYLTGFLRKVLTGCRGALGHRETSIDCDTLRELFCV